jgi:hypothetical protein
MNHESWEFNYLNLTNEIFSKKECGNKRNNNLYSKENPTGSGGTRAVGVGVRLPRKRPAMHMRRL